MSKLLSQFLESPQRPEGTMTYHELQGLLFAVACSPEMIIPSDWMPLIFNDQDANYASMEEAESVLGALMGLYNEINGQVFEGAAALPKDIRLRQPPLDNLGDAPLGQWASGFIQGHDWLAELWDEYTPAALDDELGSSMVVLSFFASRELAEAYHRELAESADESLEIFAETVLGLIEDATNSYADLGRSIGRALAEHDEQPQQPYVREQTVGRNDPCPCGSGKKYKKCCLQ